MRQSPWSWIPSLFGAEQIPAAIITYVSLLMFLQIDTPPAIATCYCGCLFIPWVLKSFLRERVRRYGHFRSQLQWLELTMALMLMVLAFSFSRYMYRGLWVFVSLFVLSFLTSWHELAARMYYERMLYPSMQRQWTWPRMFIAQLTNIFTYGMMIMLVGALQVVYRRIPRAWNEGCYLVAGVFLFLAVYHILVLQRARVGDAHHRASTLDAVRAEMLVIERMRQKPFWLLAVLMLAISLLPQSLMFYSRVLFLLAPTTEGGLGCTIQEVGFAQGTIGVIGFFLGIAVSRRLHNGPFAAHAAWLSALSLGLSPWVYVAMTFLPPASLGALSVATLSAQFFFGFGLPLCSYFVHYISGERYRNTINFLGVPLVAVAMLLPMALSGHMVGVLGFRTFFFIDALTAFVAWALLYYTDVIRKLCVTK